MKKKYLLSFIFLFCFPLITCAYSDYIIASGKNIGISLNADHVIIVGSYDVNGKNILNTSLLRIGDKLISINNKEIKSINDLQNVMNNLSSKKINVTYERDNKRYNTEVTLFKEGNTYKTGLYVKDNIKGVGTLTFIDPETKIFGALGHEILEKTTKSKFDIDSGVIYYSEVTGIIKSTDGKPGEKNARNDSSTIYGSVKENTHKGIFGIYTDEINQNKLYKVAQNNEVYVGPAKILTVTEKDVVSEYEIKILNVNANADTKNILFEVTDQSLLEKTGGIVQGMSGSPIIQNDNIVGAVNYVLVDDTKKGYGIFITNMLKEAEN